ncbi:MAG TPA: alanyl-tRNA editing protein [Actinomycetota bacterium]|nr:alanyl-tRNA editing protein [Actinomycetota bacterium]
MTNAPTDLLYQRDAYLRDFEARVVAVDERGMRVALDRTAFYPTGGGQPHDTERLEGGGRTAAVTGVRREGPLVWHELDGFLPAEGDEVRGVIDWERRHLLMRTHTALHILCGVIWRDFDAKVTGGNMEPGRARMDFEFENMKAELVREIEDKVNAEIAAARPISVEFLGRDAADHDPDLIRTKINLLPKDIREVRVVTIEGLDRQADGGTHVARTDEVGGFAVTNYKSKGRANKRVEIEVR